MSFWKRLFEGDKGFPTFDQELEILVARWTDVSRKKDEALTAQEIGRRLIFKGEQLTGTGKTRKK